MAFLLSPQIDDHFESCEKHVRDLPDHAKDDDKSV